MKTNSQPSAIVLFSLSICSLLAPTARADVLESARLLPDDMALMVSVESVNDLVAALERTSFCDLYRDPAIQQVVRAAEKEIRARLDEAIKDFWQKTKVENPPEQIPYPEGRLVLGVSLAGPDTRTDAPASDGGKGPGIQIQLVLLADMGGRAAQARQVIRALATGADAGGAAPQRKEVAGIELEIRMPREGKNEPMVCYGLKDNWLLVTVGQTSRLDFTEAVARRLGRPLPNSLADKAGLQTAVRTLGDAHVFLFVNPDAVKALLASWIKDKATLDRMIQGLGLGNVTSLASAVRIAGDRSQDLCVKTLIGVQGAPTGLPALLGSASGPLKLNERLVTRDTVGFVCASYEPAKLFDDLNKIVQTAAFQDLNMMVQVAMLATTGEGGQPPVQVRDDVLAQLGAPLLVTWKMDTPYTPASRLEFLIALPVRDGNRLDSALGRIHKAFLGGDPQLRRELLNRTLYLLPTPGRPAAASEQTATAGFQMAFSVAGDHLVLGPVEEVEQAIRNLQRQPDTALASDPMFRHARERLPSQAGVYFYRNDRRNAEIAWTTLQQMIRDLAGQTRNAAPAGIAIANPMEMLLKTLVQHIDLSQLPEFRAVEKYWGATVGFMQNRPEGLYWETTTLKPAQP